MPFDPIAAHLQIATPDRPESRARRRGHGSPRRSVCSTIGTVAAPHRTRVLRRATRFVFVLSSLCAALARPGAAQADWVGIGIGTNQARFDGPATVDFTERRGWSVGVFADVTTPLPPLAVRVEGRWVRRGGNESGAGGGAESDLVSLPLALGPRLDVGRISLFAFAGVEVGYPLATRRSPDLEVGFENETGVEFGGVLGGSIDATGPGALRWGLEVRFVRGLAGSFEGRAGQLDLRASEITFRVARPFD